MRLAGQVFMLSCFCQFTTATLIDKQFNGNLMISFLEFNNKVILTA